MEPEEGDVDLARSDDFETDRISSRCDEYHSTASLCVCVRYRTHRDFLKYINRCSFFHLMDDFIHNNIMAACIKVAPITLAEIVSYFIH